MKIYLVIDISKDFEATIIGCFKTEKEAFDMLDVAPDEHISPFTDDGEDEKIEIWEIKTGKSEGQYISKNIKRIWIEDEDGRGYWETEM